MFRNEKVRPRSLSEKELADMEKDVFDSFANYLTYCPGCGCVDRTNMYLMRARERVASLKESGRKCPVCGKCIWSLGYPDRDGRKFSD